MTRKELIGAIAAATGQTKKLTAKIVDATFKEIFQTVVEGEKINILNFGSFTPKIRNARTWKQPKTGKIYAIPKHLTPGFIPSKTFRKELLKDDNTANSEK